MAAGAFFGYAPAAPAGGSGRPGSGGQLLLRVLLTALVLAACLLAACGGADAPAPEEDLKRADAALRDRDIGDAEMYFERYLRRNPGGDQRWQVWHKLLEIALNIRQDKATAAEYLEIMLTEFADDPPRRRSIQLELAGLCDKMRDYGRAVTLWETLAADKDAPDQDLALVYRELSRAYLRRLEFSEATDVLGYCLELKVGEDTKADCLYALAETQMLTEALKESEQALRDLLQLDNVSEDRRIQAVFMLADVVEQQNRLDEAEELLERIRDSYPNARVVAMRLEGIKEKRKIKREPAPAPRPEGAREKRRQTPSRR